MITTGAWQTLWMSKKFTVGFPMGGKETVYVMQLAKRRKL